MGGDVTEQFFREFRNIRRRRDGIVLVNNISNGFDIFVLKGVQKVMDVFVVEVESPPPSMAFLDISATVSFRDTPAFLTVQRRQPDGKFRFTEPQVRFFYQSLLNTFS